MIRVICEYCTRPAELCTGREEVYPHRADLAALKFYRCVPCGAFVGCHPGTTNPLGRLANVKLRALKIAVHAAFDPIWRGNVRRGRGKNRRHARGAAYERLAQGLGIPRAECHIGMFSEAQCEQALRIITEWNPPSAEMRALSGRSGQ